MGKYSSTTAFFIGLSINLGIDFEKTTINRVEKLGSSPTLRTFTIIKKIFDNYVK